jgi:hypothetical protein
MHDNISMYRYHIPWRVIFFLFFNLLWENMATTKQKSYARKGGYQKKNILLYQPANMQRSSSNESPKSAFNYDESVISSKDVKKKKKFQHKMATICRNNSGCKKRNPILVQQNFS